MIRISLAAARVNKKLSQREMAEKISGITGIPTENLVFLANPVENGGE